MTRNLVPQVHNLSQWPAIHHHHDQQARRLWPRSFAARLSATQHRQTHCCASCSFCQAGLRLSNQQRIEVPLMQLCDKKRKYTLHQNVDSQHTQPHTPQQRETRVHLCTPPTHHHPHHKMMHTPTRHTMLHGQIHTLLHHATEQHRFSNSSKPGRTKQLPTGHNCPSALSGFGACCRLLPVSVTLLPAAQHASAYTASWPFA